MNSIENEQDHMTEAETYGAPIWSNENPISDIQILKHELREMKGLLEGFLASKPVIQNRDEEYITMMDVRKILQITKPTVYDYVRQKKFNLYKVGRKSMYKKSEVLASIKKNHV
jgi:predicted DNA-binding transcriptional regulator AlpA